MRQWRTHELSTEQCSIDKQCHRDNFSSFKQHSLLSSPLLSCCSSVVFVTHDKRREYQSVITLLKEQTIEMATKDSREVYRG